MVMRMIKIAARTMTIVMMRASIEVAAPETKNKRRNELRSARREGQQASDLDETHQQWMTSFTDPLDMAKPQ